MKRDFAPEILTDESTGCRYHTKPLACKNGVLYVELTLYDEVASDRSYRKLAVRAAKFFKQSEPAFEPAVAAKVLIIKNGTEDRDLMPAPSGQSVDAIVGIMFQEGMLN